MGKQLIERAPEVVVTCDWTGVELPADTKPTSLELDGKKYRLYLSPEGRTEVHEFKRRITSNAERVDAAAAKPSRSRGYVSDAEQKQRHTEREAYNQAHGTDLKRWSPDIREWFLAHKA